MKGHNKLTSNELTCANCFNPIAFTFALKEDGGLEFPKRITGTTHQEGVKCVKPRQARTRATILAGASKPAPKARKAKIQADIAA